MPRRLMKLSPRALAKGCLYTLALLVPGSLAVFAVVWLVRLCMASVDGGKAQIEVRQMFELEDFEPSASIERFRDMGVGGGR